MLNEYGRPSTWIAAVAVGGVVALARLLADKLSGAALDGWLYAIIGVITTLTVLGLWHGSLSLLALAGWAWDQDAKRTGAPPTVTRLIQDLHDRLTAAIEATDDDEPGPEPQRRIAYKAALIRLFTAIDAIGSASQPKLERVVPSSDSWQALTNFYCDNPPDDPVFFRGGGSAGTNLRWKLDRVLLALTTDELPLPPGPPPTIIAHVAEKRAPEKAESKKRGAAEAVVENQPAGKG